MYVSPVKKRKLKTTTKKITILMTIYLFMLKYKSRIIKCTWNIQGVPVSDAWAEKQSKWLKRHLKLTLK